MIYLISPYSHPSAAVREARYLAALSATARLMSDDDNVFSPVVYSHHLAAKVDWTWNRWMRFCIDKLRRSDSVVAYLLPDWRLSIGMRREREIAESLDMDIDTLLPTPDELAVVNAAMERWEKEERP